jgi:nucleotide-binding universal stress UspA family protein
VKALLAQRDRESGMSGSRRPSRIVVPLDGADLADRALTIARRWAETFRADLVVVGVAGEHEQPELPGGETTWHTVDDRDELVPTVVEMVSGEDASAVCVATRAHSPLVDVMADDIAQELVRSVDVPVLLVGPHCVAERLDGPVVVAHDGSQGAHAVLGAARVWAEALGVRPVVLHVHHPLGEVVDQVLPTLDDACEQVGGAALEIVHGSFPAGAIREYAHEVDASLVALSSRGRTDTLTASTGRTATWIVRESPCPVLLAHPAAGLSL